MPLAILTEHKQTWYDDEYCRVSKSIAPRHTLPWIQVQIRQAEHQFKGLQKKKTHTDSTVEVWVRLAARLDVLRAAEIDRILMT
jgi:hypothetical protein